MLVALASALKVLLRLNDIYNHASVVVETSNVATLSVKTGTFNDDTEHLLRRPFKWAKFDKD